MSLPAGRPQKKEVSPTLTYPYARARVGGDEARA